ncbi:MAG: exopolyphosphatase, partial [Campylobacterales bacterium]|nr:exopolyphosphatase [Campylobacterales bacterium]
KVAITANDITTNLPYVEGVYLAFDHHLSETMRNETKHNHIIDPDAPSAANVVYAYYGGKARFPNVSKDLMEAVDKADSAQFSKEEVLEPSGWTLLNFIMDPRTGLGRFKDFRVSNYDLMMHLIDACKDHDIDEILQMPDVKERTDILFKYEDKFKAQLLRCSVLHDNLVVLDLRDEETIYPGNRFMLYALFPDANISIHVMWGLNKQNSVLAVGKSIFNKTSKTNIGEMLLGYNGGGHQAAGTCQVDNSDVNQVLRELIARIKQDG